MPLRCHPGQESYKGSRFSGSRLCGLVIRLVQGDSKPGFRV